MNTRLLIPVSFQRMDPRALMRLLATFAVVAVLASASLSSLAQASNTFTFIGEVTNKFAPLQNTW